MQLELLDVAAGARRFHSAASWSPARPAGPRARRKSSVGEVAKRSNATDCKSVAPAASKVRILPSPPLDSPLRGSLVAGRVTDASSALSDARRAESKRAERAAKAGVTQW